MEVAQKRKVLVVEDNLFDQIRFRRMIKKIDPQATVDISCDAESAERMIDRSARKEHRKYDLILSDYQLYGEKSGWELSEFCKEKHPRLKFVLTSGQEDRDIIFSSKRTMFKIPYISKSLLLEEYINQLNQILCPSAAPQLKKSEFENSFLKLKSYLLNRYTLFYIPSLILSVIWPFHTAS